MRFVFICTAENLQAEITKAWIEQLNNPSN